MESVALIEEGTLKWHFESEKDSNARHGVLTPYHFIYSLSQLGFTPEVLAVSGWWYGKIFYIGRELGAGYECHDGKRIIADHLNIL